MPVVTCEHCGFRVYSAAGHATVDECPRCGGLLPRLTRSARLEPVLTSVVGQGAGGTHVRIDDAAFLRAEIATRLGHFPKLFEPALANPDVLRELWRQMRHEWLESDVPAYLRHAVLAALAAERPEPWAAIAAEFAPGPAYAPEPSPDDGWPEPDTPAHDEVVTLALRFLSGRDDNRAGSRLRRLLGDERYAALVAALMFLDTCRLLVRSHPTLGTATPTAADDAADPDIPQYAEPYRALLRLLVEHGHSPSPATVLDTLAESLGWQVAALWRLDEQRRMLDCVAVRALGEPARHALDAVARVSLAPGQSLVGRVFQARASLWVEDFAAEADFAVDGPIRALGMRSGLWLTVGPRDKPIGVLGLLTAERRRRDSVLQKTLARLLRESGALLGPDDGSYAERQPSTEGNAASQLAFEGASLGIALVSLEPDSAGCITEANRAMAWLTGCDVDELTGMRLRDLVVPDDADADAELMERLLAGHIPWYQTEKRFRRGGGEVFWGELSVSLIRESGSGRPLHAVVQLADVSTRTPADGALQAKHERLLSAFDEAPTGMGIVTLTGRWLQVNPALCSLLGYEEIEMLAKTVEDILDPDEVPTVRRYVRQLLSGDVLGYHIETRARHADGGVVWIQLSVSLVHDYDGAPAFFFVETQDVSERKRLEGELQRGLLQDDLTGLPNRSLLVDRLEQARARLERTGVGFALLFASVDDFGAVAERVTRSDAKRLLRAVAAHLSAAVRVGDTVARYGDDEFVIVCEDVASVDEVAAIADRVTELAPIELSGGEERVDLGISVGFTLAADPADRPTDLITRADAAMHVARQRRSRYEEYLAA